jgi:hypothetical protein
MGGPKGGGHIRCRSHRKDSQEKPTWDETGDRTKTDFAPATVADIKAGQKFFVPNGKKLEDGTVETPVIIIGSNGVAPPM